MVVMSSCDIQIYVWYVIRIGNVGADGKHTPGLLALAYQRLAESRGLAAATQVYVLFAV